MDNLEQQQISSSEDNPLIVDDSNNRNMSNVHFLPCNIHYEGSTDVNSYFQVKKSKSSNKLKSFFRGRELIGQELPLLDRNVIGMNIVQKQPESKVELNWEVTDSFDKITVWQHDIAPDITHFTEALEWFDIAGELHAI